MKTKKIEILNDPRQAKEGKKYEMIHVKVIDAHYLRNSPCGNPKVEMTLSDENFCLMHFVKTATDAACGYRLDPSSSKGKYYNFIYHTTKNGQIIINQISKEYEGK